MSYEDPNRYHESMSANSEVPLTLLERLNYVRQLVFSRTRLEARLLWNKIFQKEDEELGWLLNPYKQSWQDNDNKFTLLTTFNRNNNPDGVPVHQGGHSDYQAGRAIGEARPAKERSLAEKAIQVARYMGMGVYMTSTAFPSPMVPFNDTNLYDETVYSPRNVYTMSKIW